MTIRLGGRSADQGCGCGGPSHMCDKRRIVSITRAGDDVMVAFDDCTYVKASMNVVSESVKNSDGLAPMSELMALVERVKLLEARPATADPRVDSLLENVMLVESLQGPAFKAFKPDLPFDEH